MSPRAACRCSRSLGRTKIDDPMVVRALDYLRREQEAGRFVVSAVGAPTISTALGRRSALCNAIGVAGDGAGNPQGGRLAARRNRMRRRRLGRRRRILLSRPAQKMPAQVVSTASQTAWARARPDGSRARSTIPPVEARHPPSLTRTPRTEAGEWDEASITRRSVSPRVFYLRYHGYRAFFPDLGAVALSQSAAPATTKHVTWGL